MTLYELLYRYVIFRLPLTGNPYEWFDEEGVVKATPLLYQDNGFMLALVKIPTIPILNLK